MGGLTDRDRYIQAAVQHGWEVMPPGRFRTQVVRKTSPKVTVVTVRFNADDTIKSAMVGLVSVKGNKLAGVLAVLRG